MSYSSNVASLFEFNGVFFFSADDGTYGSELWVSDGSGDNTKLFKDINLGELSSFPGKFYVFNGRLYFLAVTSATGREIWGSDGTVQGTDLVKDIFPGPENGASSSIVSSRGQLFFAGTDPFHGSELYGTELCLAGRYGSTTQPSCEDCQYGQYNSLVEATVCENWSDCSPGAYITFNGNSTSNRRCLGCPSGKFTSEKNAPLCEKIKSCTVSEFETRKPSVDKDRSCRLCPSGQYSLSNNGNFCLPLFETACDTILVEANMNVAKLCNDLFNSTLMQNTSDVFTPKIDQAGNNPNPSNVNLAFLNLMSITAVIISSTTMLILILLLSYIFCQTTPLQNTSQIFKNSKKQLPQKANDPWHHVLEDYMSKPHMPTRIRKSGNNTTKVKPQQ
jgi:ELWxxDGT repeat protein